MKLYQLKPSCARMTDYWLGGYHNFAVDRLAARHVEATLPEAPEICREQRRFLQRAMAYMARELGLNQFIDFGSGLPTRGNVHEIVQAINPAAKVIYSDSHTSVIQAQDILDSNPNVQYVQCDAADPSELLCAPVTSQIFSNDHRVGIGFSGVSHFLSDEELARSFAVLYEWAGEGSYMAVMTISRGVERFPRLKQVLVREDILLLFPRSEQEMLKLLGPWQLTEHGTAAGPYWGLPEGMTRVKEVITETSFSFLVHKG